MASRINGVGKMLTESDGVRQPKTKSADGFRRRLMEEGGVVGGDDKGLLTGQYFDPEPTVRTM